MENRRRNLIEHTKKNISKGYSKESLKWALVDQGHSKSEVKEILEIANKELEKEKPKSVEKKEAPKIKHELYDVDNKPIRLPFFKRIFGN